MLGTTVHVDTPLMKSEFNSIVTTQLASAISECFSIDVPSTLLFDYPTTSAVQTFILETSNAMEDGFCYEEN